MVQDIGRYSDMMVELYVVFVSTEIWPLSGEDSRDIFTTGFVSVVILIDLLTFRTIQSLCY